jgi:hypothetical protein
MKCRFLLCIALTACSTPPVTVETVQPAPSAANSTFERVIAPFPIAAADGTAYDHPFLGGFDVPRPQFIDIDGDGDLDLFVQERSGEMMFFENIGTRTAARYAWRTDRYNDLDIGEWYRFVDMDGDGDFDLLGEQRYSYVKLYRNDGTRQAPSFKLLADTLRDTDGKPIFADRQNIANAADIDCDRLMDLFIGRVDGTITRYEEVEGSSASDLRFRFITDRFENIEIIGQMAGSRHGANSMYFADQDADGDADLFWGDFFEPGVLLIRNQGTCTAPNLRGRPDPVRTAAGDTILSSGYNVPVLADIDGDSDFDLFLGIIGGAFNPNRTVSDNFRFYERASGGYELRSTRFLNGIDIGSESSPALGDIDGDGDLDMLVGNKIDPTSNNSAKLYLFRNDGNARAPKYSLADTIALAATYHYAPALADLNGDNRPDLLLGTWNQGVLIYWNEGSTWRQDTSLTIQLTRGSHTTPAPVDIDGDGDLDLFIGEQSGALNFYRNTGSARAPRFELVSDEYEGIDPGRRSHPAVTDLDGDGDMDLIVAREEGGAEVYRNNGTRTSPRFERDTSVVLPLPPLGAPRFADVDGDGRTDIVVGNLSGGLYFYRGR